MDTNTLLAVLSAAVSAVLLPLCAWALYRVVNQRDRAEAALWKRDEKREKQIEELGKEFATLSSRVQEIEARLRWTTPKT